MQWRFPFVGRMCVRRPYMRSSCFGIFASSFEVRSIQCQFKFLDQRRVDAVRRFHRRADNKLDCFISEVDLVSSALHRGISSSFQLEFFQHFLGISQKIYVLCIPLSAPVESVGSWVKPV
ncbi:uncharacterized protein [Solanum tuberosum]|uniref:uncharacterized protein isoform X2 n=1 Tax=Solanum tuberosum TaxID=4113 RepID=UPI0003D2910C|nr:PREDICTED: uncharacterized protein LOC102581215 isoform X2 [Solanum tuberosum]